MISGSLPIVLAIIEKDCKEGIRRIWLVIYQLTLASWADRIPFPTSLKLGIAKWSRYGQWVIGEHLSDLVHKRNLTPILHFFFVTQLLNWEGSVYLQEGEFTGWRDPASLTDNAEQSFSSMSTHAVWSCEGRTNF